jgi:maleamate amidohydrolase
MSGQDGDLSANYANAFAGRLEFGQRPALIIVDMVMAYFDRSSPLYAGVEQALASTLRLLAGARAAGIPIILTNVVFQAGGKDGGLFYKKLPALNCFDAGSPLGAFAPGLEPRDGEMVLTKQYASAFFGTPLASTLTALGVDCLLIAGVTTSGCIRATALDSMQHGFAPFVVRDACGDRHPQPHEANLFDLQAKYAEVISEAAAANLIASIQRS